MVRLNAQASPGPVATGFSGLVGLVSLVIGVGLLVRSSSAFGAVWASLFIVCGIIVITSLVAVPRGAPQQAPSATTVTWEGESATFLPRRSGTRMLVVHGIFLLLGGWFAVMGVVGAVEENWLWPVLAVIPAMYFLGFPVFALLGRFRPGGTWMTTDRLADEHLGLRGELRLRDIATVTPWTDSIHLAPVQGVAVGYRSLTPRPWRAAPHPKDLKVRCEGWPGGSQALAAEVRARVAKANH